MTFEKKVIDKTVEKLINGKDYREEIILAINSLFLDFAVKFFQQVVRAKANDKSLTLDWYKKHFINISNYSADEAAIYAGINKKTITNIYGKASKESVLKAANVNFESLRSFIHGMESDVGTDLSISLKIACNSVPVDLSLTESLLVINALATKKIQIRGGAWSAIGKKVEKPLLDKLCELAGVPKANIDNSPFKKDKTKAYDREVDYRLISDTGIQYRTEVKLMGKGNPESADATIARNSELFVADTLSEQNCRQLEDRGVRYLILKDNTDILGDFKKILSDLNVPYAQN